MASAQWFVFRRPTDDVMWAIMKKTSNSLTFAMSPKASGQKPGPHFEWKVENVEQIFENLKGQLVHAGYVDMSSVIIGSHLYTIGMEHNGFPKLPIKQERQVVLTFGPGATVGRPASPARPVSPARPEATVLYNDKSDTTKWYVVGERLQSDGKWAVQVFVPEMVNGTQKIVPYIYGNLTEGEHRTVRAEKVAQILAAGYSVQSGSENGQRWDNWLIGKMNGGHMGKPIQLRPNDPLPPLTSRPGSPRVSPTRPAASPTVQRELELLRSQLRDSEEAKKQALQQKQTCEGNLNFSQYEITRLKSDLTSMTTNFDVTTRSLQEQIDVLNRDRKAAYEDVALCRDELHRANDHAKQANERAISADKRAHSAHAALASGFTDKENGERLVREAKEATERANAANRAAERAQHELNEALAVKARLEDELRGLQGRLGEKERQHGASLEEVRTLQAELSTVKQEVTRSRDELADANARLDAAETRAQKAVDELQSASDAAGGAHTAMIEKLSKDAEASVRAAEQARQEAARVEERLQMAEAEKAVLQNQLTFLKFEKLRLEEVNAPPTLGARPLGAVPALPISSSTHPRPQTSGTSSFLSSLFSIPETSTASSTSSTHSHSTPRPGKKSDETEDSPTVLLSTDSEFADDMDSAFSDAVEQVEEEEEEKEEEVVEDVPKPSLSRPTSPRVSPRPSKETGNKIIRTIKWLWHTITGNGPLEQLKIQIEKVETREELMDLVTNYLTLNGGKDHRKRHHLLSEIYKIIPEDDQMAKSAISTLINQEQSALLDVTGDAIANLRVKVNEDRAIKLAAIGAVRDAFLNRHFNGQEDEWNRAKVRCSEFFPAKCPQRAKLEQIYTNILNEIAEIDVVKTDDVYQSIIKQQKAATKKYLDNAIKLAKLGEQFSDTLETVPTATVVNNPETPVGPRTRAATKAALTRAP
eukprot:GILJ01011353.1.p1 GENE.GILJ01011353.1~~GILJ01011353.1.p1  ORF type:complete len:934 (+),score=110.62 GILJ01011353.1:175-2976(+)